MTKKKLAVIVLLVLVAFCVWQVQYLKKSHAVWNGEVVSETWCYPGRILCFNKGIGSGKTEKYYRLLGTFQGWDYNFSIYRISDGWID